MEYLKVYVGFVVIQLHEKDYFVHLGKYLLQVRMHQLVHHANFLFEF